MANSNTTDFNDFTVNKYKLDLPNLKYISLCWGNVLELEKRQMKRRERGERQRLKHNLLSLFQGNVLQLEKEVDEEKRKKRELQEKLNVSERKVILKQ